MKTRAAILYELNQPLRIEDVEIPVFKRGQLLVKIFYSGVCRAQYNEWIGLKGPDAFLPHLLGHEASAEVVEIGPGITKVRPGDYIALSWIKGEGLDGINSQYKSGSRTINAGGVTTFSDYAVVSENRVTRIPKTTPPESAAIVGCAVATGCGIVKNTLQATNRHSIAVFGAGGIGLCAILWARRAGCPAVIAIDIHPEKLNFALKMGATHAINAKTQNAVEAIRAIVPGGVDFAVDASGSRGAMEAAFDAAREKTGVCVIAGNLGASEKISIHPFELIKGKRIIGTWGGETHPDRDIPEYAEALSEGALPFDRLITHRFDLADINQAFELLKAGEAGRIVLSMTHD